MHILVIDNYDSFTYNLVHILESFDGVEVTVVKNDEVDFEAMDGFHKVVLSPGPGIPSEAGLLMPFLARFAESKPILGVCLGHQAIAEHFGGTLVNLSKVYHGIATLCQVQSGFEGKGLFAGLPTEFEIGRYHSWVASQENFPHVLAVTAVDESGLVMAFQHKTLPVTGVQFHPESVLTPQGKQMLENWVKR